MTFNSLRFKLTTSVAITIITVAISILFFNYWQRHNLIHNAFERNRETVVDSLIFSARENLEIGLYKSFQQRISLLVKRSDIDAIELRDESGKTVVHAPTLPTHHKRSVVKRIYSEPVSIYDIKLSENIDREISQTYLGLLIIYFNDDIVIQENRSLFYETIFILMTIILVTIVISRIAYTHLSLPISMISHSLNEIKEGNFHPKIDISRKDEIGQLADLVIETGLALEQYERSKNIERETKIAEQTSLVEREIRNSTILQYNLPTLRQLLEDSFNSLTDIVKEYEDTDSLSPLASFIMESIRNVEQMITLLRKEDILLARKNSIESLSKFFESLEKTVRLFESKKQRKITIQYENYLPEGSHFILGDLNAITRLLVLSLEYWTKIIPHDMEVFMTVAARLNKDHRINLKIYHTAKFDNAKHTVLPIANAKDAEALDEMIRKLCKFYKIRHSVSSSDDGDCSVQFDMELLTHTDPKELDSSFSKLSDNDKIVSVIGGKHFSSQLADQLNTLYVQSKRFTLSEFNTETVGSIYKTSICIFDCTDNADSTILNAHQLSAKAHSFGSLLVCVVDRKHYDMHIENKINLHEKYLADDVISYPVTTIELLKLVGCLSSGDVVRDFINNLKHDNVNE